MKPFLKSLCIIGLAYCFFMGISTNIFAKNPHRLSGVIMEKSDTLSHKDSLVNKCIDLMDKMVNLVKADSALTSPSFMEINNQLSLLGQDEEFREAAESMTPEQMEKLQKTQEKLVYYFEKKRKKDEFESKYSSMALSGDPISDYIKCVTQLNDKMKEGISLSSPECKELRMAIEYMEKPDNQVLDEKFSPNEILNYKNAQKTYAKIVNKVNQQHDKFINQYLDLVNQLITKMENGKSSDDPKFEKIHKKLEVLSKQEEMIDAVENMTSEQAQKINKAIKRYSMSLNEKQDSFEN